MGERILIANRGEIARRIATAAVESGFQPVLPVTRREWDQAAAVFADCVRVDAPEGIYLDPDALVKLAKAHGCGMVHPGYGFLAENAGFASRCREAGLVFIGPPPEAIRLMGHKEEARAIARKAGVSPTPGFSLNGKSDDEIREEAAAIGYPVLVKAALGGGGKGMRRVEHPDELNDAIRLAREEAGAYFGDDTVFVEKLITRPRHIEIQIFSFQEGGAVHLGERECTIQRRHQKIIEESPSVVVDVSLREAMGAAAVRIADAVGYRGAGTVEFILGEDRRFYFLEMNTRIQVEHPVTEMCTGVDLVKWQIAEAAGTLHPKQQAALSCRGHAIECRIYAEDPAQSFMPSPGVIQVYREPVGPGIRVESAVRSGSEIFPDFDPMIAKVICRGEDRHEAIVRMQRALRDFVILGVTTNREYLVRCLAHPAFLSGELDTGFAEQYADDLTVISEEPPQAVLLAAAWRAARHRPLADAGSGPANHPVYPPIDRRLP